MTTPNTPQLYDEYAWIWPIISPPKDYESEAEEFAALIRQYARRPVYTLLDLGCGGGHNDFTLKRFFTVHGVDISPAMLALARQLNPEISYTCADMRSVRLSELFDAVIIADSIDYMLDEADLRAAFAAAYAHLHPGGVFCTYAEISRERFLDNETSTSFHEQGGVHVALMEYDFDPDPADTTVEMAFVYLIRRGDELLTVTDRHRAGIFSLDEWQRWLAETGFEVIRLDTTHEHPTFVCRKPLVATAPAPC